jgi:hypothetical protein
LEWEELTARAKDGQEKSGSIEWGGWPFEGARWQRNTTGVEVLDPACQTEIGLGEKDGIARPGHRFALYRAKSAFPKTNAFQSHFMVAAARHRAPISTGEMSTYMTEKFLGD